MIPFSIACGLFGRPFAAKGETDPNQFIAVIKWLDVELDRGVVWLMRGPDMKAVCSCTAKGWVQHLEEVGADLVGTEALDDAWKAVPDRLKEMYATNGVGACRPWPSE